MTDPANNICKFHSGVMSELDHLKNENIIQWERIKAMQDKVDKILNRLTTASITFALAALALIINLLVGAIK